MTRTEKIDYIREKRPEYKKTSTLFAYDMRKLDEIIEKIDNPQSAKEKYYENVKPRKASEKMQELKRQHKHLQDKFSKVQLENIELKNKVKSLEKKLKRIGEICNAEN